jgi:hypothetical protein
MLYIGTTSRQQTPRACLNPEAKMRKLLLFTVTVLLPALVVGISNFTVFPDSLIPATIMLVITAGAAAIFTWQSSNATAKIARYCVCADFVICAILCLNLAGHWILAREVSAAKLGVTERHAEEDRQLDREKARRNWRSPARRPTRNSPVRTFVSRTPRPAAWRNSPGANGDPHCALPTLSRRRRRNLFSLWRSFRLRPSPA